MDERELDDARLLELVGEVLDRTEPVPADALETARAAELSTIDAQLAELVFDSLLDDRPVTLRAGAESDVRSLTFTAGEQTIEVDLSAGDILGRISPPDEARLDVLQATVRRTVTTDALGRFRSAIDPGPLRLRIARVGSVTTTPWITR